MPEKQNIEYKQSWRDDYLKWICGFANAHGGVIYIGIDDRGNVTGLDDYKKFMDDIPNKIVQQLGLVVDVDLHEDARGKKYIEIKVPQSTVPISYHAIYHYRSGSTKQELKGTALYNWLLKKSGNSWEDIAVPNATIDDLDMETVQSFLNRAITKDRIPASAADEDVYSLMKRLNLLTSDGKLTNAAILLFGKQIQALSPTTSFKIGRFGADSTDLLFQDVIETNLLTMVEKVMDKLKVRYLIRPISYKGIERMEPLEYPESALREAVLNAIIHKDYSSTWILLRVYEDRLHLWNPGILPEELSIEELKQEHSSYPRNRNIAGVFFKAGYVEAWGRGTNDIINAFLQAGLPEPVIEESQGGLSVVFLKDIYTEEYLRKLDINDRQVKALLHIKEYGSITNSEYQKLNDLKKTASTTELVDLYEKGLIKKIGTTGRGTKYIFSARNGR
ncbi:transcriptional regulator [Chitinophaga caeni]|uniref:Transcriptional regulator n=1 Tax=Chitinophaga caeni TaxID=2029983 RepID=A0A291QSB5_9BACT|nr:ATP-binding protein [Chitinophaga caeni]ATL46909.1 transcriptional regulator [Chitinophaga caeni]